MASDQPKYPPNLGIVGSIKDNKFDVILEKFKPYMKYLAARYAHQIGPSDDTYQELSLVLWKCFLRYSDKKTSEFVALARGSMNNRIVDIARKKIPWTFTDSTYNQHDGDNVSFVLMGRVNDEEFYDRGLRQLRENGTTELKQHVENATKNARPKVRTKRLLQLIGEAVE